MYRHGGLWAPDGCTGIKLPFQTAVRDYSVNLCKQFRTAIDVGAHIGSWSIDLQKKFDRVVAFEPVQDHRECFAKNVDNKRGNVELLPYGLGSHDHTAVMEIFQEGNTGTMSVVDKEHGVLVHICRLDDFSIVPVDYLKVDIEGYEMQFLDGAQRTLTRRQPVLCIEIKDTCDRFGYTPADIRCRIQDMGMEEVGQFGADFVYVWPEMVGANG